MNEPLASVNDAPVSNGNKTRETPIEIQWNGVGSGVPGAIKTTDKTVRGLIRTPHNTVASGDKFYRFF